MAGVVIFALVTAFLMMACAIPFLVCDRRRVNSTGGIDKTGSRNEENKLVSATNPTGDMTPTREVDSDASDNPDLHFGP